MANLLIAISALIIIKVLQYTGLLETTLQSIAEPLWLFLVYALIMNVSLAIFNLLPFPPLDGSKILQTFLPNSMQPILTTLEQYGFIILLALMYMGFFRIIFTPVQGFIAYLIRL